MNQCSVCQKEFIPTRLYPRQKYCCTKCNANASHRRKKKLSVCNLSFDCAVCGKNFVQKRANNTEYCNSACKKLGVFRKFKGFPVFGPRKHVRGTGHITKNGYRIISRNHPNARVRSKTSGKGQIMEHMWVMSNHIGRPLHKHETVHHRNGIRDDNRIENLELWSHSHPFGQRVEDKLQWCKEFLEQYGHRVIMNSNAINLEVIS